MMIRPSFIALWASGNLLAGNAAQWSWMADGRVNHTFSLSGWLTMCCNASRSMRSLQG